MFPSHIEQLDGTTFRNRIDGSTLQLVESDGTAFLIDRCAVSCARLQKFVRESGIDPASLFSDPDLDPGFLLDPRAADYPVQYISLRAALEYCRWSGTTLPTVEQWMLASYGTDGRAYPWGNEWAHDNCQHADRALVDPLPEDVRDAIRRHPLPPYEYPMAEPPVVAVDSFPHAASPFGLLGCLGNVEEWCAADERSWTVGGSYLWFPEHLTRERILVPGVPALEAAGVGFRSLIPA